jgi:hypothetical protein
MTSAGERRPRAKAARRAACLVLACALGLAPGWCFSQGEPVREGSMKAAYVYHFMRYTNWPGESKPALRHNLCLLGQDAMTVELEKLHGRPIGTGRIEVQKLNSVRDIRACHVLFISERDIENTGLINRVIGDAPVLTLSDSPQASDVAIKLVLDNSRLLFDVDLDLLRVGGISMSSKALQLARNVRGQRS